MKFKSVEQLEGLIQEYFDKCIENKEPYTITGLALALNTSRETLINYEKRDEYFDTIKRAKLQCHNYAEKHLFGGKNVAGAIFNLKNNYGWRDKTETDITSKGEVIKGFQYVIPDKPKETKTDE